MSQNVLGPTERAVENRFENQPVRQSTPKSSRWLKSFFGLVVAIAIFGAGWSLGSGRISLGSHQSSGTAGLPAQLDFSSVNTVYQALKSNFDGKLTADQLLNGIKTGLVQATGDPFTEYMTAKEAKNFNDELGGNFSGIGAELGQNSSHQIQIISPLAGYPAEKAGLKPQDVILGINGKPTAGMSVSAAVKAIRGKAGTTVNLQVSRGDQALNFKITRGNITVPSVESKVVDGVGYLTISRFGDDTASAARQAATKFKDQHVKGVVVDLRGNPGGLLEAAVSVSSLWLNQQQTVLTERRDGVTINTYRASGDSPLAGLPTVVLIDGGSASAAEITAGALHDNGVATLVGTQSYGKGSVQQIVKLGNGSILKVTVARWFTPKGKNIDKAGIKPDKVVKFSNDDLTSGHDPQMTAAQTALEQAISN